MDCPEEYYNNCQNALYKCKNCRAGEYKKGKLWYVPLETKPELKKHPAEKSSFKQKRTQEAKYVEKRVKENIAKGTLRSGAARADGDIHLLNNSRKLRLEVKDRGRRNSWNLTYSEFLEGKRDRIDIYAISAECPDQRRRTFYMMEEEFFTDLLALLQQSLDQLPTDKSGDCPNQIG